MRRVNGHAASRGPKELCQRVLDALRSTGVNELRREARREVEALVELAEQNEPGVAGELLGLSLNLEGTIETGGQGRSVGVTHRMSGQVRVAQTEVVEHYRINPAPVTF